MVRVWVAGKTVRYYCYTWAISEHFKAEGLIIKCYINSSVYLTLLYFWYQTGIVLVLYLWTQL